MKTKSLVLLLILSLNSCVMFAQIHHTKILQIPIKHKAPALNLTGIITSFDEDSLLLNVEFYRALDVVDVVLYRNGVEVESDSFFIEAMTGLEYDFTNAQTGTYTIVIVKDDEEIYQFEFYI